MCSMYEDIDDEAFIGRKQYFILMFKVNFLELGLLLLLLLFFSFFLFFFFEIYIHIT
jgi:Ca2+/Na+ antiporter